MNLVQGEHTIDSVRLGKIFRFGKQPAMTGKMHCGYLNGRSGSQAGKKKMAARAGLIMSKNKYR